MNSPELSRLNPHLEAAVQRIRTAADQAAERCAEGLGLAALSAGQIKRREALLSTQFLFRKQQGLFSQRFYQALRTQLQQELEVKVSANSASKKKDWGELSLMDDDQVDALVVSDRIGLAIGHQSEWELREVDSYIAGLSGGERNPLRPEVIGQALLAAVHAVAEEEEARQILVDELTRALAQEMRVCYADIAELFRTRGLRPQDLRVRGVDANSSTRNQFLSGHSQTGGLDEGGGNGGRFAASSHGGSFAGAGQAFGPTGAPRGAYTGATQQGFAGQGLSGQGSGGLGAVDAQLMDLLRRLAHAPTGAGGHEQQGFSQPAQLGSQWGEDFNPSTWQAAPLPNLIHLHKEELRQAATGRLDHMVIDVVSSLFDQVLADPKVPPQMGRLLAGLQLPVLRAALGDQTFFSSRRHPVRRFVNRLASLACAFDDFSVNPGLAFLAHVQDLVQDVANGDFDRMDVYEGKLDALEQFIAEQIGNALTQQGDAATLLARKEIDLRLQQRYAQQLQAALVPVPMPDFIRDFLSQAWSAAIILAGREAGSTPEREQRIRQFGRDLVMSVQPKSGTAQRQVFLGQLPKLMQTLNEGLDLMAWPDAQRKEFFGHLLPAHAESLKGPALTALEANLLAKQLDGVFGIAPPSEADLGPDSRSGVPQDVDMASRLSANEAKSLGLIHESAIDWSGKVDIDLSADAPLQAVDISIEGLPASTEAPEPSSGKLLIDHLQLGFAYQMHTGDSWHKVRLAHISAGRSFFIFTQGAKHQETVTMTARMLIRLCEANRMRAFENAYLLERAISRARKQLAAIKV